MKNKYKDINHLELKIYLDQNDKHYEMKHFIHSCLFIFSITLIFSSCLIDTKGKSGRTPGVEYGAINNNVNTNSANSLCVKSYNYTNDTCLDSCGIGTHIGDGTEVALVLDDLKFDQTITDLVRTKLQDNIASSKEVCVQGNGIKRPSDLAFEPNFCVCLLGKSHLLQNSCDSVCASNAGADQSLTLHASIKLGAASASHPKLGNLFNWCNVAIAGSENNAPVCKLEALSEFGNSIIDVIISNGSLNFTADLTGQPYQKPIIITLKEQFSGSKSDSVQLFLKEPKVISSYPQTPIKIMPVSQYTCLTKLASIPNPNIPTQVISTNVVRNHFYFASNNNPISIPPGNNFYVCHDQINGTFDNILFPRLELRPNHMAVWDQSDPRFVASTVTPTAPVINDVIMEKYNALVAGKAAPLTKLDIFQSLQSLSSPIAKGSSRLGYYMIPFQNSQSFDAFCLTSQNYNDPSQPLHQAIGQYIGVDTEAVYIAQREPLYFPDDQGNPAAAPADFLFINETLLKQIWFYTENGLYYIPNDITVKSKTINFYWPPDPINPLIKKSTQRTFTVRSGDEINAINGGAAPPLNTATAVASDKRLGCIPKAN